MADEKSESDRFKVSGRQVLEFDLLDDESKEAVIKCIREKGRISVVVKDVGIIADTRATGFRQLID